LYVLMFEVLNCQKATQTSLYQKTVWKYNIHEKVGVDLVLIHQQAKGQFHSQ